MVSMALLISNMHKILLIEIYKIQERGDVKSAKENKKHLKEDKPNLISSYKSHTALQFLELKYNENPLDCFRISDKKK